MNSGLGRETFSFLLRLLSVLVGVWVGGVGGGARCREVGVGGRDVRLNLI